MKFVVKERNRIFVAHRDNLDEKILREKILSTDVCLSDLDETDAISPAKKIAIYDNIPSLRMLNPKFAYWVIKGGLRYFINLLKGDGKKAESDTWKEYIGYFLMNPRELEKLEKEFDEEQIKKLIYDGVPEFYRLLPRTHKVYLSRNIQLVVNAIGDFLYFQEKRFEIFDKEREAINFVEENSKKKSKFKRYLLRGDSIEDEAVYDVLDSYRKKGHIDYVVSIFVQKNPRFNNKSDVVSSRNQTGLVSFLSN